METFSLLIYGLCVVVEVKWMKILNTSLKIALYVKIKFNQVCCKEYVILYLGSNMDMFYCGWNGCGQVDGFPCIISSPKGLTCDGRIVSVSCCFSVLTVATDKSVTCTGFIGNELGSRQEVTLPDDSKAVQVSSCLKHTLIASNTGKCYSYNAESNSVRQLVDFFSTETCNEGMNYSGDNTIIKVTCNEFSNLAVTEKGRLFTIPSLVNMPGVVVTDVSCGNEHCLLLTENGSVFSWGSGSRGQLGHGDLESEENPCLVETLAGIQVNCISSGAWHNAVVSSSGDLYTWGWGSDGQLGVEEDDQQQDKSPKTKRNETVPESLMICEKDKKYRGIVQTFPIPVDCPIDVKDVSCGTRHTVVLLVDGSVWGCGWNYYGQLGCPPDQFTQITNLRQISIPDFQGRISKIQCGGWSSCFIV